METVALVELAKALGEVPADRRETALLLALTEAVGSSARRRKQATAALKSTAITAAVLARAGAQTRAEDQ